MVMSTEKDDAIEEFDFDDEYSDSWDDDFLDGEDSQNILELDESSNELTENTEDEDAPKRKSSTSKLLSLVIVLGVLGGGAYVASPYLSLLSAPKSPSVPVVVIDSSEAVISSPPSGMIDEQNDTPVTAPEVVSTEETKSPSTQSSLPGNDEVLTPFPDLSTIPDSELPLLSEIGADIAIQHAEEVVAVEEGSAIHEPAEQTEPLDKYSEEEFLSKTDEAFAEEPIQQKEAPQNSKEEATVHVEKSDAVIEEDVQKADDIATTPATNTDDHLQQETTLIAEKSDNSVPSPTLDAKTDTDTTQVDKSSQHKKPSKSAVTIAPQKTPVWIIKGAQPNRAVIYDKISGETKNVEVGNFVRGIGRIKFIKKIDGKWRISGSQSTVKQ